MIYRRFPEVIKSKHWSEMALEAVVQRCSVKKVFLKFRKIYRETNVPESLFLIKWQASGLNFKETLTQLFSSESCEFSEHFLLQSTYGGCFCCLSSLVYGIFRAFRFSEIVTQRRYRNQLFQKKIARVPGKPHANQNKILVDQYQFISIETSPLSGSLSLIYLAAIWVMFTVLGQCSFIGSFSVYFHFTLE